MKINLNDNVTIALTPEGVEAYRRHLKALHPGFVNMNRDKLTTEPRTWQLWDFMRVFGASMGVGYPRQPIQNNTIEIADPSASLDAQDAGRITRAMLEIETIAHRAIEGRELGGATVVDYWAADDPPTPEAPCSDDELEAQNEAAPVTVQSPYSELEAGSEADRGLLVKPHHVR